MDATARARLFIFNLHHFLFASVVYGAFIFKILVVNCFNTAARYSANLTQLLFIYLQYVNNKYSEISTINDNIFHNFPCNEFVTLPQIFSSHVL